jgi:hypothetical protein
MPDEFGANTPLKLVPVKSETSLVVVGTKRKRNGTYYFLQTNNKAQSHIFEKQEKQHFIAH